MAKKVSGITVEIGGDTSKLGKALGDVNKKSRSLQTELRGVNTLLKYDPKNVTLTQQKQDLLTKAVSNTKSKLDKLREAQVQVQAQFDKGEITEEQYRDFQRELAQTEKQLKTYEKQLAQVSKEHRTLEDSLEIASGKLKDVGGKMVDVGKDMSLKVTAPIAALGGVSIKAASDFESAFAGVKKTVEATDAEFEELEKGIRQMAKEIPASASEIAGVAEAAGQLGIQKDKILGFTRTIIDLGEATDLSLEQGATEFARFANIVDMSQDDFGKLGSTVVALGNNFATTESEIVALSMRLAAQGTQIGLSEAEIMALSATMSSLGLSAEAGGTAMTTVMKKIQVAVDEGGESVQGFADVAGVSSEEFSEAFKNEPIKAIDMFIKGLDKTSKEGGNLTNTLGELGIKGVRETDTLMRMAGASDTLSEAVGTSTKAWEENTALTDEAAQRYETFESKMSVLKNSIVDLGIDIGNILMPAILKLVEHISNAVKWFSGLSDGMKKTIVVVSGILAAIGPLLVIFGKFALGLSRIIDLALKVKPMFIAIKVAVMGITLPMVILAAKIALVIAAVVAIIAIIKNWGAITDWIKEKFNALVDWFKAVFIPIFDSIGNGIKSFVEGAKNAVSTFKDNVVNTFTAVRDGVVNVVTMLADKLSFIFTAIKEVIGNIVVGAVENVVTLFQGMADLATGVVQGFATILQGIWLLIYNIVTAPVRLIVAFVQGGFEGMRDKALSIFMSLHEGVGNIINGVKEVITSVITAILDTFVTIFTNIKDRTVNNFNIMKIMLSTIIGAVKDFVIGKITELHTGFINIVTNIKNGVVNLFTGLRDGVVNTVNNLKNSAVNIFNSMKTAIPNIVENTKAAVVNKFKSMVTGAVNVFNNFLSSARNIFTNIGNTIKNLMKIDLGQIGSDIIAGLARGITGAIGKVKDAVSNVGNAIAGGFKSFFGIHSPSRLMRDVVGKMIPQGIAVGIEADTDEALEAVDDMNQQLMAANDPDMLNLMDKKPTFSTQRNMSETANRNSSEVSGKLDRLVGVFDKYLDKLSSQNYQVVLETGVLVGEMKNDIDKALGHEQEMKERGM